MYRCATAITVVSVFTLHASATITPSIIVTTDGGSVANNLHVTTTDYGWSGAQIFVELTQGSVINLDPALGGVDYSPTALQLQTFPALQFDTYVGRVGGFEQVVSGAVELGGAEPWTLGPSGINAEWYYSSTSHATVNDLSIGNFVFSDDAQGTWSLAVAEQYYQTVRLFGGTLADGVLTTDFVPGDLNVDGFTGLDDLDIVLGQWNTDGSGDPRADPTGDLFVGLADLDNVLGHWNAGTMQSPWPEGTTGDLNGDGFVGIEDLNWILGQWHQHVSPVTGGDASGDGFVGFDDLVIVQTTWGSGGSIILLPEPAAATIVSFGTLMLLRRRSA